MPHIAASRPAKAIVHALGSAGTGAGGVDLADLVDFETGDGEKGGKGNLKALNANPVGEIRA